MLVVDAADSRRFEFEFAHRPAGLRFDVPKERGELRRTVLAATFMAALVMAGSAQGASLAFGNPYVSEKAIERMKTIYAMPLALPEWLPTGYRYKGFVANKKDQLVVGYVKRGRLMWFLLENAACRSKRVVTVRIPVGKSARRCALGAGIVTVWSHGERQAVINRVTRQVGSPWRKTGA